jgi:hypothetical protein
LYPLVPNTSASTNLSSNRLQSAYAIAPGIVNMTGLPWLPAYQRDQAHNDSSVANHAAQNRSLQFQQ